MAFRELKTRDGTNVLLFGSVKIGDRPVMGCYFTGSDFIPVSWLPSGRWYDDEVTHRLDLIDYEPA